MENLCPDIVWMCNVCSQAQKDIFILPCQHKFCERCLHVWVGVYTDTYRPGHQEFPCRVCWQINYLPRDGLKAYHRNYDVCQLELTLSNMNMMQQQQKDNHINSSKSTLSSNNPFYTMANNFNSTAQAMDTPSISISNDNCQIDEQQLQKQYFAAADDLNCDSPQRELNHFVGDQLKMSSSAPEFHNTITSPHQDESPFLNNPITADNSNEMDMVEQIDSTVSAQDVVCHLQDSTNCTTNGYRLAYKDLPVGDSDRMIQHRLCFPNTCNMYHHMM